MAMDNPARRRDSRRILWAVAASLLCLLLLGTAGCGKDKADDPDQARLRPPPGSELGDADAHGSPSATETDLTADRTPESVTPTGEAAPGGTAAVAAVRDIREPSAGLESGTTTGATTGAGERPAADSGSISSPPRRTTTAAAPPRGESTARGPYIVQVGSFQQRERAADRVKALRVAGIEAEIVEAFVDGLLYHRVFVMGQTSLDEATWLGERLAAEYGFSYLVRKQP